MRGTRRVILGLACIFSATVSLAQCADTVALKEELKDSEAVIIATVTASSPVPQSWYTFEGINYVVHVDQTIKGKRSEEITIFSEHSQDGYDLKEGTQYLLFLSHNYDHWVVNQCGNSGTMDQHGKVIKGLIHLTNND